MWEGREYRGEAGFEEAGRQLAQGLHLISELGAEVDGEVGPADPINAVRTLFDRVLSVDRILLSTFTVDLSQWLRLDVPHRLTRLTDIPTEHIQSDAAVDLA
jgi:hypothetical protein